MSMHEREGIIDIDPSYRSRRKLHSPWSHHGIGVPDPAGGFPIIDTKSIAASEAQLPRQPGIGEQIYNLDAVRAYHPRKNKRTILSHGAPVGPYPLDPLGLHEAEPESGGLYLSPDG